MERADGIESVASIENPPSLVGRQAGYAILVEEEKDEEEEGEEEQSRGREKRG